MRPGRGLARLRAGRQANGRAGGRAGPRTRTRRNHARTAVSRPESIEFDVPDLVNQAIPSAEAGLVQGEHAGTRSRLSYMSGARTIKNGAHTGLFRRKSIVFDVPDPANPSNLSADARNVLAGALV